MAKSRGEKYISDHTNPATKIEAFGSKLFITSPSEEEEKLKEKCLASLENVLRCDRVERRFARNVAEWLPEQQMALMTKIKGSSSAGFGSQNKNGKFLNNEEALFLLETNRLELTQNKVPLSIQEAYKNITFNCDKYQVYKKLVMQGFKVKPLKSDDEEVKRKLQTGEGPPAKVPRIEVEENEMMEFFEKLRQVGPQSFQSTRKDTRTGDYTIMKAEKSNLIIDPNEDFTPIEPNLENSTVYTFCSDDNVSFFIFNSTSIPIL